MWFISEQLKKRLLCAYEVLDFHFHFRSCENGVKTCIFFFSSFLPASDFEHFGQLPLIPVLSTSGPPRLSCFWWEFRLCQLWSKRPHSGFVFVPSLQSGRRAGRSHDPAGSGQLWLWVTQRKHKSKRWEEVWEWQSSTGDMGSSQRHNLHQRWPADSPSGAKRPGQRTGTDWCSALSQILFLGFIPITSGIWSSCWREELDGPQIHCKPALNTFQPRLWLTPCPHSDYS